MEAIDKFLQRYERHKWLYVLTSPVLLPLGFILMVVVWALAGVLIFVSEGFDEYGDYIKAYPRRYRAIWCGDEGDGQA